MLFVYFADGDKISGFKQQSGAFSFVKMGLGIVTVIHVQVQALIGIYQVVAGIVYKIQAKAINPVILVAEAVFFRIIIMVGVFFIGNIQKFVIYIGITVEMNPHSDKERLKNFVGYRFMKFKIIVIHGLLDGAVIEILKFGTPRNDVCSQSIIGLRENIITEISTKE